MLIPSPCDVLDAESRQGPSLAHARAVAEEEAGAQGRDVLAFSGTFSPGVTLQLPNRLLPNRKVDLVSLATVHDRLELGKRGFKIKGSVRYARRKDSNDRTPASTKIVEKYEPECRSAFPH